MEKKLTAPRSSTIRNARLMKYCRHLFVPRTRIAPCATVAARHGLSAGGWVFGHRPSISLRGQKSGARMEGPR